jgi:hypothetical protein
MSVRVSRAGSWLKSGNSAQWISQVRWWSCASGLLKSAVSMDSLTLLISSSEASQLTERISQASLPQVAALVLSLSVDYKVLAGSLEHVRRGDAYENAESVEQIGGIRVCAAAVLERAKLVQLIHHVQRNAVVVL